ncbi:hypothetical protein MRB53_030732 [Persea americana]|uniref:Uncharacterized protein n=1 Tax=Persea americana TaxID=3435 RepID=A0ACC2KMD8_PERAE|nr:hypothetical protein MRB53_030732 [Persea americana]
MAEKTSLCFTLLLTFLPLFNCSNSPQPIHFNCSGDTNYTAHSTFVDNLHKILHSLTERGPSKGFYTNSNGENPNRVFGLALCRGDTSADTCRTCLDTASSGVIEKCPMRKTAIIWYDLCFLRYSNKQFLPSLGSEDMVYLPNQTGGVSKLYCLKHHLDMFMRQLSQDPTWGLSKIMFEAASTKWDFVQRFYVMVQCSRDLSMSNCYQCLQAAVDRIPNCSYSKGGRVLGSSCNLRFEFYQVYNSNDPTYSSPQPPHANGNNRSRITNRKSLPPEYIVAIVVMAIIATMMLLCIVATCLLMRPKEKENCRVAPEVPLSVLNAVAPEVPLESRNAEPLKFDLDAILAATSNFSEENKLRECSLGHVYKGTLFDGREIEVNRLQWDSSQGIEQLKNEGHRKWNCHILPQNWHPNRGPPIVKASIAAILAATIEPSDFESPYAITLDSV